MAQCIRERLCMTGWTTMIAVMAFIACASPCRNAWSAEDTPACLSATGEEAIASCRRELLSHPNDVEIRFALSDALMGLRRYAEAVAVLQEGLENAPGDETIKKKLTLAESYLDEQRYIEKQKKSAAATSRSKTQDTQIRLSIIRCEKLKGDAAMAACNEGLAVNPDHPGLLIGRGNVWLEMDRFGNAIRDYEAALSADSKNREATKSLRLARTKREVKVAQCIQADGTDGLKACEAALMKGADDEFAIQKRRAELLQAMGHEEEAIEAYQAAARLNPADGRIQQILATLDPKSETTTQQAPEPSPVIGQATDAATIKPPPQKKSPTQSREPAPAPKKARVASSKPPVQSPPAKAAVGKPEPPVKPPVDKAATRTSEPVVQPPPAKVVEPPAVEKALPAPAKASPPIAVAAAQPRRFSNAPEVPGITH